MGAVVSDAGSRRQVSGSSPSGTRQESGEQGEQGSRGEQGSGEERGSGEQRRRCGDEERRREEREQKRKKKRTRVRARFCILFFSRLAFLLDSVFAPVAGLRLACIWLAAPCYGVFVLDVHLACICLASGMHLVGACV